MTITVPLLTTPVADDSDSVTFAVRAGRNILELNPMFTAANLQNAENNAINANVNTKHAALEISTAASLAASNYKGEWSTLAGALAVPASASRDGVMYVLKQSVANVALEVPGVSTNWIDQSVDSSDFVPIINGDMSIKQYSNIGNSPLSSTHLIDGWTFGISSSGQVAVATPETGSAGARKRNWISISVLTADTSVGAGDFVLLSAPIEGPLAKVLVGRTFTVSFDVMSNVVGAFCACLRSPNGTSYIAQYTVNVADAIERKSFTVEAGINDGVGTWDFSSGITGVRLEFSMMCGTTNQNTAGAWQSGGVATSAQTNLLATVGNSISFSEVQFDFGRVPRNFRRHSLMDNLRRCQRYYRETSFYMSGYALQDSGIQQTYPLEPPMCKLITITTTATSTINVAGVGAAGLGLNFESIICGGTKNGTPGSYSLGGRNKLDARIS